MGQRPRHSDLGTATCLASLHGFDACGIEIEPELVKRAKQLAKDFELNPTFLKTSFLPEGFDFLKTQGGRELSKPSGLLRTNASYPDTDWGLEDIDVFYTYPWPAEQESTLELFETIAADGAYLICYYGDGEICIYKKVLDQDPAKYYEYGRSTC